jgi:hypothetical protein
MDMLRDWIKQVVLEKHFLESDLDRETRKRLRYFMEDNMALFDYYKNPREYDKKRNIEKVRNTKHVWIYGAGVVGARVAEEMNRERYGEKVEGMVVSTRENHPPVDGYNVYCIDDISSNPSETLFLISVSSKYHDEVIDTLESKGYENYIIWL